MQQKMSNLPVDRMEVSPPFTYTGVDLFGPFYIKVRRSLLKRYGVMYTCLASRAVHLENAHSMETDSFIMTLRRLISRRGNVRLIRSDNGTNSSEQTNSYTTSTCGWITRKLRIF